MHGNDSRVAIWSRWMKELGTYLHIHGVILVSHPGLILSSDSGRQARTLLPDGKRRDHAAPNTHVMNTRGW